MIKEMTCIICPLGCTLVCELSDNKLISVSGNTCPRGAKYAEDECINPRRCVTSTVICEDNSLLPVKTDRPIPKDKVMECMKIINSVTAPLPVSAGDVIIEDVFGSNIIATKDSGD